MLVNIYSYASHVLYFLLIGYFEIKLLIISML